MRPIPESALPAALKGIFRPRLLVFISGASLTRFIVTYRGSSLTTRRGFLSACIATFTAPAIVRASSLMASRGIIVPTLAEVVSVGSCAPVFTMGTSLPSIDIITREVLAILERELVFEAGTTRTRKYELPFSANRIMKIRQPLRFH